MITVIFGTVELLTAFTIFAPLRMILDAGTVRLANPRYSVGRTDDVLEVFEVLEQLASA